jgi:hypothetical protein
MIATKPFQLHKFLIAGLVILLVVGAIPTWAQNYRFYVPSLKMNVYIQPDASARIAYDITFRNALGAHVIDVVDVGMPHARYNFATMKAAINGAPLTDIRRSEYVKPGVEVHLRGYSINPGAEGTFHFEFTMPDMVFQDTTRADYASFRITPTWFGEQFVLGSTDIDIAVHMLPDIKPEELLYQNVPFTSKAIFQDRAVAIWQTKGPLTGPYLVGISFPKRGMERVVKMTKFGLLLKWFKENKDVRVVAGIIFIAAFAFVFFRFSGRTGCSVFVVLLAALIYLFVISPTAHLIAFPVLGGLFALNEWSLSKRKKTYLPPFAEIEAGRIKRGLTAPEAAVLLELPLNKVLTLVLFGLLKKGVLKQVKDVPLTVNIHETFTPDPSNIEAAKNPIKFRRTVAQEKGIVIHDYEEAFIAALEANRFKPVPEIDFGAPMRILIEGVISRMKGFDPEITRSYYRSIIRKAMAQASAIGDIPEKDKTIDRNLEWILINDNYPTVLSSPGYHYRPGWGWSTSSPAPKPGIPSGPGGKTTLGDVTASFAGWTENTMNNVASAISPRSLQLSSAQRGVVNLGGFDKVTGDVFQALAESASSGGGGGGGCACACAGCACACACAGGGR